MRRQRGNEGVTALSNSVFVGALIAGERQQIERRKIPR